MSCDVASAALYIASAETSMGKSAILSPHRGASAAGAVLFGRAFLSPAEASPPKILISSPALNGLAREPLYADIVRRARGLQARVESLSRNGGGEGTGAALRPEIEALSALDLQAHFDLAKRGTDGDLKCILKGISQDLPLKLALVEKAGDVEARKTALAEMAYLLRDNVEVITAPPRPPA